MVGRGVEERGLWGVYGGFLAESGVEDEVRKGCMGRVCRHTSANAPLEEDASNRRRRMVDHIRKSLEYNKGLNKNLLISIVDPMVELYVV